MNGLKKLFSGIDKATAIAFACILLLLFLGALYDPNFLSREYLAQQLLTASFLGVMATGMMLVILLGHIDLSIPWTITMGAMMATASTGFFGETLGYAAGHPVRHLRGRAGRLHQRARGRLPPRTVDDLHPRHERGGAGPDGVPHRRVLAAGRRHAADARDGGRPDHSRRRQSAF